MRRAAALGLVALVFAVGLAAGVLGARLVHAPGHGGDPRDPMPLHRYFRHNDLDLTADQRRQLEEILSRQRVKFREVHEEVRPRVEALMDETQSAIEAILSPEQLERYRARRDRWHRRPRRQGPGRDDRRHRDRDRPPPEAVPPAALEAPPGPEDGSP